MTHTLDELLDGMASRDPDVRDGWAYQELCDGILGGRFAAEHETIRARMVDTLADGEIQARAFAPLGLAWLVGAGDRDEAAFEVFANWYAAESDTRGYDPERGWLHAVAHGADYLGEATKAGIVAPDRTLELAAQRMIAEGPIWAQQEDARLGVAILAALARVEPDSCSDWFATIGRALDSFEAASTVPPPAWPRNVSMTLSGLYLALAEQPMDGVDETSIEESVALAVRSGCAEVISRLQPWMVRPRCA